MLGNNRRLKKFTSTEISKMVKNTKVGLPLPAQIFTPIEFRSLSSPPTIGESIKNSIQPPLPLYTNLTSYRFEPMDKNSNPLNNFIVTSQALETRQDLRSLAFGASFAPSLPTSLLAHRIEADFDNIVRPVFDPAFATFLARANRDQPESGVYYADQEGNLHDSTQADPSP